MSVRDSYVHRRADGGDLMLDRKRRTPISPIVLDAAWQQYIDQLERKHRAEENARRKRLKTEIEHLLEELENGPGSCGEAWVSNEDGQYDHDLAEQEGWGGQHDYKQTT